MAGLGSMLPLPCLSGTLGAATDVKAQEERRYQKLKSNHSSGCNRERDRHNSTKMRAKWRKKRTRRLKRKRRKTRARSK
ncbi:hypothetical protein O988_02837 [Pseudogymnoascus sp. VKM F-3808]|nr:hypothetical protein O988_02837 [Pseudogymnoascus sp. VKM F-3808]